MIPGSSIIQFEVNEEGERRNSRLPGGQLVNILGGGQARFSFLRHAAILAAETATSQDNPGKEQAAPESWKHHHLRLFANSTPILKFYCRPATDGDPGIFLRPTFWEISSERKPIFLTAVCGFSGSFLAQETAGCRQIFDDHVRSTEVHWRVWLFRLAITV